MKIFIKSILYSLLLITCFISNGCEEENNTQPPTSGTIQGIITNSSDGSPISNAVVQTNPATSSVVSDQNGGFTINDIVSGTYTVTASKNGYSYNSVDVSVVAGKTTTANIQLTTSEVIIFFDDFESGSLSGYSVPSGHTLPVLTNIASFSPTHSVTLVSPRNNYGMMGRAITPAINNAIIGYSCKIMKSNLTDKSNMLLMLFSETVGPQKELVIGFYRDSIYVAIENDSNPNENTFDNVQIIEANKWYDFKIEYNFSNNKAAFYIDGNKVLESNYTVTSVDYFYLGDYNSDITPILDKVMFIDDIKVYKR